MKVNTEWCIDLKTKLHNETLMIPGKEYMGILRHDIPNKRNGYDDTHYTFIEMLPNFIGKKNPRLFRGKYITVTRRDDGSLRLNFRPIQMQEGFNAKRYASGVAKEITNALKGLIEE